MLRLVVLAGLVAAAVDARSSKWHDSLNVIRGRGMQATPSPSPSPSEAPSMAPSAAVTPSMSTSNAPSAAVTPSMSASNAASAAVTPSMSASNAASAAVTPSMSGTMTGTMTGTATGTPMPSVSVGASQSRTATPSQSASTTPEGTRSATRSGSRTPAPTRSVGASTTRTPSATGTASASNLPSRTGSQTPRPSMSMALVSLPPMVPAVVVIKQTVNGIPIGTITLGIALELRRSFCSAVFNLAIRRGLPLPPCTMARICTRGGFCISIEIVALVNAVPIRFLMESNTLDNSRLLPDMRFSANVPRDLQSADTDLVVDYNMEVEAPNTAVDNTGDGTAIVAAQQVAAAQLVSALQSTEGTSAIAAAMEPAVVDAALAAGVSDLSAVSTSVDTTSAQVTTTNPRAPSNNDPAGLSGGAIAGIVIAVLVVTGLIVGAVIYSSRNSRKPVAPADGGAGGGGAAGGDSGPMV